MFLHEVYNSSIFPELAAMAVTTSGGAATLGAGGDAFTAAVSGGTGLSSLTLRELYSRAPVVVAGRSTANIAANGGGYVNGNPSLTTIALGTHSGGAGAGDDGTAYAIAMGWNGTDSIAYKPRCNIVKINRDKTRLLAFKVDTSLSGIINIGSSLATISRTGTGDVTLTFKHPFGNDNVVGVPTAIRGARAEIGVETVSRTAIRIKCFANGAATDMSFYLLVVGSFSFNTTEPARAERVLHTPIRKARICAGRIDYSGGVPGLGIGSAQEFSLTDTGTGDVAVTLATKFAFAREPIVIACPSTAQLVTLKSAATGTGFSLTSYSAAGIAADATSLHFIALGSDDATSEYWV